MKKSLIALAVMAAAGAASAQSSVQLYGIADVWFGSTKASFNGVGTAETKVDSGGINTSRVGIKGSEDLGNGLKANFQLEKAISVDTGDAASGFDRIAAVGLAGGFGEVSLGRNFTAYDDIRGTANNTFDANFAATATTWAGYNASIANTIKYVSPNFGGFSGAVSYALGEDKGFSSNDKASRTVALNVQYANGPLFVGYAFQQEKTGFNTTPIFTPAVIAAVFGGSWGFAEGDKVSYNLFTASYDFGVAKLVGGYNQAKAKYVSGGYDKANEFQIGAEVPLAANLNLGVGYAQSKVKDDAGTWGKSTGYSAALVYSLSKRTSVYAALNNSKFEEVGGTDELKTRLYGVGINHKF